MKKAYIAGIATIAFQLGMIALDAAAKKHAKSRASIKAVETRTEEQAIALKECTERCDIYKTMKDRESKETADQIKAWKISKEFDKRKNLVLSEVDDGLVDFKVSIDYSGASDALQEAYDAGVEAFKNTIEYDANKEKLQEAIKEAQEHYEQQKQAFAAAGDDISETTMKLRHAAEEAMESKVKEAKEKIAELDKQLQAETDKLKKVKLEKTKTLEEKVSKEKIRLQKKQEKDLEKLNQELDSAKNDIQKKVQKLRTAIEDEAVARHEDDIRLIEDMKKLDAEVATDIYEKMDSHERIAEFLTDKKVPKWLAGAIAMVPIVPIEYLVYRYARFAWNTIRAMGTAE